MEQKTSMNLILIATICFLGGLILSVLGMLRVAPPAVMFVGVGLIAVAVMMRLVGVFSR